MNHNKFNQLKKFKFPVAEVRSGMFGVDWRKSRIVSVFGKRKTEIDSMTCITHVEIFFCLFEKGQKKMPTWKFIGDGVLHLLSFEMVLWSVFTANFQFECTIALIDAISG